VPDTYLNVSNSSDTGGIVLVDVPSNRVAEYVDGS
jgi:hypothetical protein